MSPILRANMVSKEYTGNTTIPEDSKRSYFFIVMTSGTGSVEFGNVKAGETAGGVPLEEGAHFRPTVCPICEIRVITEGTYTIVIG